jgi:hypothetical protein
MALLLSALILAACVSIQNGDPVLPEEEVEILGTVKADFVAYEVFHRPDQDFLLDTAQDKLGKAAEKQFEGDNITIRNINLNGAFTPWVFFWPFSPYIFGHFQKIEATGTVVRLLSPPIENGRLFDYYFGVSLTQPLPPTFDINSVSYPDRSLRFGTNANLYSGLVTGLEMALTSKSKKFLKGFSAAVSLLLDTDLEASLIGKLAGNISWQGFLLRASGGELTGWIDTADMSYIQTSETYNFSNRFFEAGLFYNITGPINLGFMYGNYQTPAVLNAIYPPEHKSSRKDYGVLDEDLNYQFYNLALYMDTFTWYMRAPRQRRLIRFGLWIEGAFSLGLGRVKPSDEGMERLQTAHPEYRLTGTISDFGLNINEDWYVGLMMTIQPKLRFRIGVGIGLATNMRVMFKSEEDFTASPGEINVDPLSIFMVKTGPSIKVGASF